jgi:hypothetical protein
MAKSGTTGSSNTNSMNSGAGSQGKTLPSNSK